MGKHKRKRRNSSTDEVEKRLRRLEECLDYRSRHNSPDDYYERRSIQSRSRSRSSHRGEPRGRTRSRRRSPFQFPSPAHDANHNSQGGKQGGADLEEAEVTVTTPMEAPLGYQNDTLLADIEGLLGPEGTPSTNNSIDLHECLVKRWMAILQDGLDSEVKSNIIKKYNMPNNCNLLAPPKLNEEIAAAMNESGLKRDKRISDQQNTLCAAITAIGKILNDMINNKQNVKEIEILSDSARLLCELHNENSKTRRSLILPGLNKDVKELMEKSSISEFLFGDKLQDKVNACKAVKKSAQELKNTPAQPKLTNKTKKTLNYQGPQRQQMQLRPSGQKPKQKRQTYQTITPRMSHSRRSPPRQQQHHRRSHYRR